MGSKETSDHCCLFPVSLKSLKTLTWTVFCWIIVQVGNKFNTQQLVCLKRKLTSFVHLTWCIVYWLHHVELHLVNLLGFSKVFDHNDYNIVIQKLASLGFQRFP